MEVHKEFFKNRFGCSIVKCCASCKHKQYDNNNRKCEIDGSAVRPDYLCSDRWEMSDKLDNAGKGGGKVKRREYLMSVLSDKSVGLSLASIREDFEKVHGSIYVTSR